MSIWPGVVQTVFKDEASIFRTSADPLPQHPCRVAGRSGVLCSSPRQLFPTLRPHSSPSAILKNASNFSGDFVWPRAVQPYKS